MTPAGAATDAADATDAAEGLRDTERPSAPGLTDGGSRAFGPALVCGLGVRRLSAGRCAGSCDGRKRRYGRALAVL